MKTRAILIAVLLAGLGAYPARCQNAAELLQKGIYTQETVGDLDGAIKIYRQVVASSSESRASAAQAQYRLGQCLLKKGATADATQAFKTLINDYPEQTDLVAKAKAYLPAAFDLLPAPWTDGEVLEYDLSAQNGMKAGKIFLGTNVGSPNSTFESRMYSMGMLPMVTRVEFESDSMRPVREVMLARPMLDASVEFDSQQAKVVQAGKDTKMVPLDGLVFSNEQITQMLRRLPLRSGYKLTVPILSVVGMTVKLELTASGPEEITVPAGKFRCFKVEVIGQSIWVSAEGSRPVVKMSAMGVTTELASIHNQQDLAPVSYHDAKQRFGLQLPGGWSAAQLPSSGDTTAVMLTDPEAKAMIIVSLTDKKTNPQITKDLRDGVDEMAKQRAGYYKDYVIHPETIQTLQINGKQGISAIADYTEGDRKALDYHVWVRSADSRVYFMVKTNPGDLVSLRKRLDPIVQTLQMP